MVDDVPGLQAPVSFPCGAREKLQQVAVREGLEGVAVGKEGHVQFVPEEPLLRQVRGEGPVAVPRKEVLEPPQQETRHDVPLVVRPED